MEGDVIHRWNVQEGIEPIAPSGFGIRIKTFLNKEF